MASWVEDPLKSVLLQYASGISLGTKRPIKAEPVPDKLDTAALIQDLDRAQKRNTVRFAIVFAFLAVGLLAGIGLSIWPPTGVKPPYMVAGSGFYTAGVGAMLLSIARSWWRTDMIITVAKFSSPDSLKLVLQDLLTQELRSPPARRSTRTRNTTPAGSAGG